jgi:hypothetical protein
MRTFSTILYFLIFSNSIQAFEKFPVHKLIPHQDRIGVFEMETHPSLKLTLDCDSFLFGVFIQNSMRNDFFHLFEGECYEVSEKISQWTQSGESACFMIDLAKKDWKLEKGTDACQ